MKKFGMLLLCIVIVCMSLVSCDESKFGYFDEYKDYYNPVVRKNVELDFYIIVEDGTTNNAISTVSRMINTYVKDQFTTTLKLHYVTAAEYAAKVNGAVNATDATRADIVLVAGEEMFDSLYDNGLLVDLADYYNSTDYGRLNTQIASNLLDASYIGDSIYTVPNNHIIGSYELVLVNTDVAEKHYNYSLDKIKSWVSYEMTAELRGKIADDGLYTVEDSVKYVTGAKYTDIAKYESEGYTCNIAKYPEADRAEAFKSAFAIIKDSQDNGNVANGETPAYLERYDRAMEVIYALNTDVYFRNLLQYGIQGTNYTLSEEGHVIRNTTGSGVYNMNLLYTGDLFKAYYCDVLEWDKDVSDYGVVQNEQSVIPNP